MPTRRVSSRVLIGTTVALVLCGCTPGGQFDPTELISSDVFTSKKTLQGDREPVFPNGVPGAETGVPPDLVKGYQPPPEQAADNADSAIKPAAAPAKPKPKPKPKPAIARAPAPPPPPHDAAWDQKPASPAVQAARPAQSPWQDPQQPSPAQTNWPAPPSASQAQQAAQPAQTNWPAPPPTGQAQQAPQSGQSIWPNPPPSGTLGTSSH
jgi:hypothetical protein